MAKVTDSGKIVGFNYSENDLEKAINEYKNGVETGEYVNPCPPQFFSVLGISKDIVQTVLYLGNDTGNTWYKRAVLLKNALEWLRAEMASELHWQANKSVKTMFLLKQDWGDGVTLEDKPDPKRKAEQKRFVLSAGGGDKRAKDIWG